MKDELRVRWTPPVRRPDSDISFPPPSTTDSKISGYLNKQGARGPLKTWKKRWFIFDKETGELFYYISESTSQPLGVIDIDSCEVHRNHSGSKREFTIHYISTGRIYYLSATSEQEVSFWVTHFLEWKSLKGNSRSTPSRGANFTRSKTIFSSAAPPSPINFSLSRSSPQTSPPSPQSVLAISPRNGRLRRDETKERGLTIHEEDEDKKSELLDELSHRLLVDIQDVHSVRKLLSSFHRPLTAGDTQYISLQLIRQMEYLNLVLQEVSQYTAVKEEEKSEVIQDEYTEEAITGHFFMLPSGLAYYLFSFLEPADLSRACQVCRTWKTYAENPVLWAQFMATPSSKYDNQKNWKALYISTQQPKTKQQVRAVSIYGMPPTSFGGSVKEGWLHKRNDDLLKTYKRRWFVIRENCLIYYKTPKDNLPCGVIPLADLSFALVKGTGRKHCFKLSNHALKEQGGHGKVEIVLSADSEEDCLSWVSELRNTMPNLSNLQSLTVPTDGRSRDISPLSRSVSSIAFTTPLEKLYPYFGVSLATLMAQQQQSGDDTKIPSVIDKAITYLSEKALDEEGLLRISGSLSEIQSMKMIIEQGKELDFTAHDPHAVAGLVKSFFRELPERLVPPDLNAYAATVAAEQTSIDGNTIVVNKQQKIDEFRFIIQSLPVHNHNLLRALIQFLLKVASHADKNKMTENNVLRVIIPTIHCNPQLFAYCMQHFTALFNDGYL